MIHQTFGTFAIDVLRIFQCCILQVVDIYTDETMREHNHYFILINITGHWQNRDYMYTNRFMKRKDIDFIVKVWIQFSSCKANLENFTGLLIIFKVELLCSNRYDCYVCFKQNWKRLICIYVSWISNGNIKSEHLFSHVYVDYHSSRN